MRACAISRRVGMDRNQVAKWRRRYLRDGLGTLQDEPRSRRVALESWTRVQGDLGMMIAMFAGFFFVFIDVGRSWKAGGALPGVQSRPSPDQRALRICAAPAIHRD